MTRQAATHSVAAPFSLSLVITQETTMLKLLVLLGLLASSQAVADCIQAALQPNVVRAWCLAVAAQVAMCGLVLMVLGDASFGNALFGAAGVTYVIRSYFMFKRS